MCRLRIGRAGRDGKKSVSVVFHNKQEIGRFVCFFLLLFCHPVIAVEVLHVEV